MFPIYVILTTHLTSNVCGYNWATMILGENKFRNLALQVGGVSNLWQ
jgi:hypothetical protein